MKNGIYLLVSVIQSRVWFRVVPCVRPVSPLRLRIPRQMFSRIHLARRREIDWRWADKRGLVDLVSRAEDPEIVTSVMDFSEGLASCYVVTYGA